VASPIQRFLLMSAQYLSFIHPSFLMKKQAFPSTSGSWEAYWRERQQEWRTEPEISAERQKELAKRRTIITDIDKDIYPFTNVQLNRADIEWLLATYKLRYEAGLPSSNEEQGDPIGLDLRGATIIGGKWHDVNLSFLPLDYLNKLSIFDQVDIGMKRAFLENKYITCTIQGNANFYRASLKHADLSEMNLVQASFNMATMEGIDFCYSNLEKASFLEAMMEHANFMYAHLDNARFANAKLTKAFFHSAHLEHAVFSGAYLENADFTDANLNGADFSFTNLTKAFLIKACLDNAVLISANLKNANLSYAHLEGTNLSKAHLEKVHLHEAYIGNCNFENIVLGDENAVGPYMADVHWGNANLATIDWAQISILGDEYEARKRIEEDGVRKKRSQRLEEYRRATRANRQLMVALQNQGLTEEAARFAYRAQVLQKTVYRLQLIQPAIKFKERSNIFSAWLLSWFLFLLAGYGYRVWRSFLTYLLVITGFAAIYCLLGQRFGPHIAWYEAIVVSMTAFHGRGFSPSTFIPGDPLSIASAIEAVVGLIIEITLIATLTQRFFSK
jgi:uncharacterized protein YjbI with pentapeptide repeats